MVSQKKVGLTGKQVRTLNRIFGLGRFVKRNRNSHPDSGVIQVPDGHRCPLCPDHQDDEREFVWSPLLQQSVCIGCKYDIWHGFYLCPDETSLAGYNNAETIRRIMKLTGLRFQQAKFQYLREYTMGLPVRDRIMTLDARQLGDTKLRFWNGQIEYELEMERITADAAKFNVRWEEKFTHIREELAQQEKGCAV